METTNRTEHRTDVNVIHPNGEIEYHDGYMDCMDKRDGRTLRYITNERNYR